MKMGNNIMGFLGLCRKAGFLLYGHDTVKESIVKNKAFLVILSSDSSQRLKDEITSLACADGRNVKVINSSFTMNDFAVCTGKKSGVFSVTDNGFAKRMEIMFGEA